MRAAFLVIIVVLLAIAGVWGLRQAQRSNVNVPVPVGPGKLYNVPGRPTGENAISVVVTSPGNNSTVSTPTVTVTGKTVANADVSVNDTDVVADTNGNFSATVELDEGDNTIVVNANDANGNAAEQELTVTFSPGV